MKNQKTFPRHWPGPDIERHRVPSDPHLELINLPPFTFEDEPPGEFLEDWRAKLKSNGTFSLYSENDGPTPDMAFNQARESLIELCQTSWEGDVPAIQRFLEMSRWMCDQLSEMERFAPDILANLGTTSINWPMNIGPGNAYIREAKRRLEILQIGAKAPIRIAPSGKQPDFFASPSYKLLFRLYVYVSNVRLMWLQGDMWLAEKNVWANEAITLLELDKKTAPAWFEVMWKILLYATDNKPESRPELKALGEGREYDSEFYEGRKNPPLRTRIAKIRNGIKTRLKRDFFKMIRADSP